MTAPQHPVTAGDRISMPDPKQAAIRRAISGVLTGGNHLALLIGADHPPYRAEPLDALAHYGSIDTYEMWCCWRAIMLFRDEIEYFGPSPAPTEPQSPAQMTEEEK